MKSATIRYKNYLCLLISAAFFAGCQSPKNEIPEGFKIHPDFNLQLVASEPLVFDPVDMQFDENGRAFVLEMPGYPMSDVESRLIELIDSNDDGVYDKRQVMEDKLGIATSFMPYKDGFLVASPPHLIWIGDTNHDGKIDKKETLIDGFSTGNLQHNFNGLTYAIDNWIYAANGGNSGRPFFENRPESAIDLRETDLKFNLEKSQLARVGHSSGGFKLTFDDWGHLFETHNTQHILHLVFEDRYLDNLPVSPSNALSNISDHEENGLARIYPIGEQETRMNHPEQSGYFSGACGITHYGGGAFPEGFNNSFFVADCVLNLVHMDVLSDEGSSFKASRMRDKVEFLASKDRSFRPVNLSVGPDGALYVIDMHRDVIEHPEWIPDEMEAKMDLNAGKDKGRIYRITPKTNWLPGEPNLKIDNAETLVKALGSTNQWSRNTAQRLLVTKKMNAAVPFLKAQLNSKNPLSRLHCLWTLEGLGELESSLLKKALRDPSPGVRENAIKIAEVRLDTESGLVDGIIALTKDPDARIRMQAALSLSNLTGENDMKYKASIGEAMLQMMPDTSNDTWTTMAIATAIQQQALPFSTKLLETEKENLTGVHHDILLILSEKIGKNRNAGELGALLRAIHTNDLKNDLKTKLLEALSSGWKKSSGEELDRTGARKLTTAIGALESDDNDVALIRATGHLRQATGLPASDKIGSLMRVASKSIFDDELSTEGRMEQLQLLALEDFDKRTAILFRLLDNKQPLALQKEALSQLRESNDPGVGKKLLELWPGLAPETRKIAADILLYKSFNHDQLLTAMEKNKVSLGEFNLDLERRRVLLFSDDENIRNRAEALFSDAGVVKRKDAIEKMRPALSMQGDATAGEAVFKAQCAQCHRYGETGKQVGPVLTEINRKSKESLMHDLLDPNAAVNTQYLSYQIKTRDGSILTGLVFHETDTEIGLRMMGGAEEIIPKNSIEKFSSLGTSLMFEGLETNMSLQEMADLLAFLQQPITDL